MTTNAPTTDQIRTAWDTIADDFDRHVTPGNTRLGDYALGKVGLRAGMSFLDVAGGSGALSLPAARRGATVVATDIAPTMIERLTARAEAEGLGAIDGRTMDGMSLEFDDDTFDVVGSQHGVSVFPDVAGGLAEMARVTKPGGRVLVVAFGALPKAEFFGMFIGAMRAAVPGFSPPLDPPPLPFQLAEPAVFDGRLTAAGLTDTTVETLRWELRFASVAEYWNMVSSGHPIARQILSQATEDQRADARSVLEGMLRERSGGTPDAVVYAEINIGTGTK